MFRRYYDEDYQEPIPKRLVQEYNVLDNSIMEYTALGEIDVNFRVLSGYLSDGKCGVLLLGNFDTYFAEVENEKAVKVLYGR